MTSISNGGGLTQQLYMKLFDRLDADKDGALSVREVEAAGTSAKDSTSIINRLDADGDGSVSRAEMLPSRTFGTETLGSLIAAQSDADRMKLSTEIVADLFKRADLDGDGALSVDEMKAESDLRRAANVDAGFASDTVLIPRDKNGDGLLTQDEVAVGQRITTPLKLIFSDETAEDVQKVFQAHRERMGLPPVEPVSEAEKAARRAQLDADQTERSSGPAGTVKFLSSEIESLREKAMAAYGAGAQLSDSLSQRLIHQIMSETWSTNA